MQVRPLPKPKLHKHRARNNPRPTADRVCRECGQIFAERHECFYGPLRQLSIQYGLQVDLCHEHHRGDNGPHHNRMVNLQYKREAQARFEQEHGHEEFMRIFLKSYL